MEFRQSTSFKIELEQAVLLYLEIDTELASCLLAEIEVIQKHLSTFPEAAPLTSIPPIRKCILKSFPYRVRYIYENHQVVFLTLEHMLQDKAL